MGFPLTIDTKIDDLGRLSTAVRSNFIEFSRDLAILGGNNGQTNEDKPIMSATELQSIKSPFQRCIDYVDISWPSAARGRQTREEWVKSAVFTARCTLVQSAVLRLHVVCLSVCPSVRLSVTLVDCDHIGWNTSEIISPLVSLGYSLSVNGNIMGLLQGEHPEILA